MQLYQDLLASLIDISMMWKRGDPSPVALARLRAACQQCRQCIDRITAMLGENGRFPKAHELEHIPKYVEMFGSADGNETGMFLRGFTLITFVCNSSIVDLGLAPAGCYETLHCDSGKLYEHSTRQVAKIVKEVLEKHLLLEFCDFKARRICCRSINMPSRLIFL